MSALNSGRSWLCYIKVIKKGCSCCPLDTLVLSGRARTRRPSVSQFEVTGGDWDMMH